MKFTEIRVENVTGETEIVDLSKQIGNAIYNQSKDCGEAILAQRIYKGEDVELTKENMETVTKHTGGYPYPLRKGIEDAMKQ